MSSLIPASQKEREAADALKTAAEPLTTELTEAAKHVAEGLKEPAQEAMENVKATAADATEHVKAEGQGAVADVKDRIPRPRTTSGRPVPPEPGRLPALTRRAAGLCLTR